MAERPTPYSISVCTLIALQSDPSSPLNQVLNPSTELQERLSSFLQDCVLLDDTNCWLTAQTMSLPGLFARLQRSSGSTELCELVLDYVHLAATSVDSLLDLMESLRQAMAAGIVCFTSAHGIFLRKVCLGFDQLSFELISLLWSDLQAELNAAVQSFRRNEEPSWPCEYHGDAITDNTHYWPMSAGQIESAVRNDCFQLHEISNRNDGRALSFESIEVHLKQVLAHNSELPAVHFLRFLNCIEYGERVVAMDSLHQYFDYAIIQGHTSEGGKSQDILQFASILLASFHDSFGGRALARMAADEGVRVAQQSMDAACVAFALGWIYSSGRQHPKEEQVGTGMDSLINAVSVLQRCASRSMEGHLRSLAAGANLSLARDHTVAATNAASHGEFAAMAWESLADASTDRRTGAEASDDGGVDRPTHMTGVTSSREVMDTLARQKLVSAGIWDCFGQTNLSAVSSFLTLYCHADQILASDVITAIEILSRMSLYGLHSYLLPSDFDENVFKNHIGEENNNMTPPCEAKAKTVCVYGQALKSKILLWKLFRLAMDGVFLVGVALILDEWAVRRGEFEHATAFNSALQSYINPRFPNYWELLIDIFSLKSLCLCRQRRWAEAKRVINDMIMIARDNHLMTHYASLLLQLGLLNLDSNPHEFASGMTALMECLNLTDKQKMDGVHATALSVFAQVHFRMKNPRRAISQIRATLPFLLQGEHVWFQGEAYLTLAKSRLQLAKIAKKDDSEERQEQAAMIKKPVLVRLLLSALGDLQKCQDCFEKCQDVLRLQEVFYMQARLFHSLGNYSQRDYMSQAFINISKHLISADQAMVGEKLVMSCLSEVSPLEKMASRKIPLPDTIKAAC